LSRSGAARRTDLRNPEEVRVRPIARAVFPAARGALDAFLAAGHGLVGRGATGAALGSAAGLPAARSPYAPVWFTDLGPGVRVEQSYATGNPLVAGHWRPAADGSGGPTAAAGRLCVVSGPQAVPFGTDPLFRDHPKGELPQVGRALFTMAHASSGSVEESG
jgi:hypothetical protein